MMQSHTKQPAKAGVVIPDRFGELSGIVEYVEGQLNNSPQNTYVDSQTITGKYVAKRDGGFFEEIVWNIAVKKVRDNYWIRLGRVISDWDRVESETEYIFTGLSLSDLIEQVDSTMMEVDKCKLLI
jgi:hypothetical protein